MRSDLTPALAKRYRRVGSGPPAPAHPGEGCHCVPAAGGAERWNFGRQRVLRPRVSVAVSQARGELPKLQEGKGPREADGAQVLSPGGMRERANLGFSLLVPTPLGFPRHFRGLCVVGGWSVGHVSM